MGKIVFDDAARSLDCTIRDISDSGARVRWAGGELLPPEVHLIEVRRGLAFRARVAWARGAELGLTFLETHDLNQASSPALRAMRRIWMEHVAR